MWDLVDDFDDEPADLPGTEGERVAYYRSRIRERCDIPETPAHALHPVLMNDIALVRHALQIHVPQAFEENEKYRYFLEREKPSAAYYKLKGRAVVFDGRRATEAITARQYFPHYYDVDAQTVLRDYESTLDEKKVMRPGAIEYPTDDTVVVRLPIRRPARMSPSRVAEGVFYHQFLNDMWNWTYASPDLFAEIEGHVKGQNVTDPFEWAHKRAAIAAGYSDVAIGKDCSVPFLAEAYERMASTACNTMPEFHLEPRGYEVGDEEKTLLSALHELHPHGVSPEMVSIVLDNAVILDPATLRRAAFVDFFAQLPRLLENGFNIDRLEEFSRHPSQEGTAAQRLEAAMTMAMQIYGGTKPWWFKEDFDLTTAFDAHPVPAGQSIFVHNDSAGRALLETVARKAGFAFTHALAAYKKGGSRLAELPPFTADDAIDFTVCVTQGYGIGNPNRAERVIALCLDFLRDAPEPERRDRLEALRQILDESKPRTPLIGRMEPDDASFYLPGLSGLVFTALGKPEAYAREVSPLHVSADNIRALTIPLSQPLGERARMPLALSSEVEHMESRALLAGQGPEGRRLLPLPDDTLEPVAARSPLLGVIDFYEQLRRECGGLDDGVATHYFNFCAMRMPDPWRPPPGFLKFLQNFRYIQDQNQRWIYLEHPDDRDRIGKQNMGHTVNKWLVLANILDARIMGLLTEQELQAFCAWVTAEASPQFRALTRQRIEAERAHYAENVVETRRVEKESEPDLPDLTPQEVEQRVGELIKRHIEEACGRQQSELQTVRLEMLKRAFTSISVINSLAAVRYFSRDQLSGVLRSIVSPQALPASSSNMLTLIGSRPELAAASELASRNLVDYERLRGDLDACDTPEAAKGVLDELMKTAHLDLLNRSRAMIVLAVKAVELAMEKFSTNGEEPGAAVEKLRRIVTEQRDYLTRELDQMWQGTAYIVGDVVDRILTDEFRVPQYVELFGPLQRFNREVLPSRLPAAPSAANVADIHLANEHSARLFYFVGSRWIQEQSGGGQGAFTRLLEQHGPESRINLRDGANALVRLSADAFHSDDVADHYAKLASKLPEFQKQVDQWRLADVPFGSIGGRWHFDNPVHDEHLQLFAKLLGLGQTPFRMIHANTSLIIPAFMSRREMKAFILMLALEGLIDPKKPELQIGVPGRLVPSLCAYFGSSAMLGTAECAPFKPESFVAHGDWNNWASGARIVAYDAYEASGGRNWDLPFMSKNGTLGENVDGRTDILGRWHVRLDASLERPTVDTMDDIDIAHIVGGALRHVQYGGPLAEAGRAYMHRHRTILGDHNLSDVLKAPWVFGREGEAYQEKGAHSREHFDRCVHPCMEAHFRDAERFGKGKGVVFDVRTNIDTLIRQAEDIRRDILKDPRYADHVRALLQVTPYESIRI